MSCSLCTDSSTELITFGVDGGDEVEIELCAGCKADIAAENWVEVLERAKP